MRFLPLKIMVLCFMTPMILYTITLNFAVMYFEHSYKTQIENIHLKNNNAVIMGDILVEEEVEKNIMDFLTSRNRIEKILFSLQVFVLSDSGQMIYPKTHHPPDKKINNFLKDNLKIARQNWETIKQGLKIKIVLIPTNNSKIFLLIFYSFFSVVIFLPFYFKILKNNKDYEESQKSKVKRLIQEEESYKKKISEIASQYQRLQDSEEEMMEEIISLEDKLLYFTTLKRDNQREIDKLNKRIIELEKTNKTETSKSNDNVVEKRFKTLYKNIEMSKKAFEGFNLAEIEAQIKIEEIISLLNTEPEKVMIKRKVFSGKKNKQTTYETSFSSQGRIYFKKKEAGKIKIAGIGTKNTQKKDLDFL